MEEQKEIWKSITLPSGEVFNVSSFGIIMAGGKELRTIKFVRKSGKGKGNKVPCSVFFKGKYYQAARLIAYAFVDGYEYGNQVGYRDMDCFNLNASNIYDPKQNVIEDLQGEVWKQFPYPGYEDYMVSNMGRVKRANEKITSGRLRPKKIIKPFVRHGGYLSIAVYGNTEKKTRMFLLHRVVADAFIPNTNNFPQINHIDEDKFNNCVSNLEWCTGEYNLRYGTRVARTAYSNSHHLKAISKSGEVVYFDSLADAYRKTRISPTTINKRLIDGEYWKGYTWHRV